MEHLIKDTKVLFKKVKKYMAIYLNMIKQITLLGKRH